jgi:hypothetical protein
VRITLYSKGANATNGGPDGNEPRIAQFIDPTRTVPISQGMYGGVTKWLILFSDDPDAVADVVTAGSTINSTGTYFNLVPYQGVYYFNSIADFNSDAENAIYIDQTTFADGNEDIYQVVPTSANQSSWLVYAHQGLNNNLLNTLVDVGSNSLTGANDQYSYILVIPDTPAPSDIRFTFYATAQNAQNGGADGTEPRLAQFTDTTYTVPTATGVYAGVTKWRVILSDDANSLASGTYLTSGTTFRGSGTYYNLAPYGGVFYYNTSSHIIR